jgi:hypothetical protein
MRQEEKKQLPYEVIERAAIIEYEGNFPRKEAERLALESYRNKNEIEG